MDKGLWQKISGSINFYIRGLCEEDFNNSNEKILKQYLEVLEDIETGGYSYIDKKSFEFVPLNAEDIKKIEGAFLERVGKKRQKY